MIPDLLLYWGDNKLQRYSQSSTQCLFIPQSSKNFLEQIGLPVVDDPRFRFKPEAFTFVRVDGDESYHRIGVYDATAICVKEGKGEVYWYDRDNCALFMNSSVESFALLVTLYHQMPQRQQSDPLCDLGLIETKIAHDVPRVEGFAAASSN